MKSVILSNLDAMKCVNQSKYLGLPMLIGRTKCQMFGFIEEMIKTKLNNWKEKLLNQAGKEVLIKLVIMSLPKYTMSCYRLPTKTCKKNKWDDC